MLIEPTDEASRGLGSQQRSRAEAKLLRIAGMPNSSSLEGSFDAGGVPDNGES